MEANSQEICHITAYNDSLEAVPYIPGIAEPPPEWVRKACDRAAPQEDWGGPEYGPRATGGVYMGGLVVDSRLYRDLAFQYAPQAKILPKVLRSVSCSLSTGVLTGRERKLPMHRVMFVVATVVMFALQPARTLAEEFRIESQTFVDDQTEPVDEKVTLFAGGIVYQIDADSPEVVVFKKPSGSSPGRFVLLDSDRRLRAELTTDEIRNFMTQLKASAATQSDPVVRFAANPHFEQTFVEGADDQEGELTLESEVLQYRIVTLKAKDRSHLDQYREFSDWISQLTTMLNVGSTPPFPRLAVNAAVVEQDSLASEVHLTIRAQRPHRKTDVTIHAFYRVHWRISTEDRQLIDRADHDLVTFKEVDFAEYRRR